MIVSEVNEEALVIISVLTVVARRMSGLMTGMTQKKKQTGATNIASTQNDMNLVVALATTSTTVSFPRIILGKHIREPSFQMQILLPFR
jgi:hypothetical protein